MIMTKHQEPTTYGQTGTEAGKKRNSQRRWRVLSVALISTCRRNLRRCALYSQKALLISVSKYGTDWPGLLPNVTNWSRCSFQRRWCYFRGVYVIYVKSIYLLNMLIKMLFYDHKYYTGYFFTSKWFDLLRCYLLNVVVQ